MRNLNIKTYKQPAETSICGPCCIKMVTQHFGLNLSLKSIKQHCHCTNEGSLETSVVLAISEIGLHPILYALPSGGLLFGKYADLPKEKVISNLKVRAKLVKSRLFAMALREAAELVEQDLIRFQLANRDIIEKELDKGNPWIACCHYYILSKQKENRGAEMSHFIVIQGYDKNHFIINDPLDGVYKVEKDLMLCAMYSISPYEISAICVSKR